MVEQPAPSTLCLLQQVAASADMVFFQMEQTDSGLNKTYDL